MSVQNDPSANQLAAAEAGLRSAVDVFITQVHGIILGLQNNPDPEPVSEETEEDPWAVVHEADQA